MIADRIKTLREQSGMTQAQLAKRLGISRSAVNAWEMGISCPSVFYLMELADIFHMTTDYILCRDPKATLVIDRLSQEKQQILIRLVECLGQDAP